LAHHYETKSNQRVRVLDDIDWVAFGPVIEGASPGTGTLDAKLRTQTKAGARSSAADSAAAQKAHDFLLQAHPELSCNPDNMPGRKGRQSAVDEELALRWRLLDVSDIYSGEEAVLRNRARLLNLSELGA
jgi:hypothetical protein